MRIFVAIAAVTSALLAISACKKQDDDGAGGGGSNHTGSPGCEPLCQDFASSGCSDSPTYDGCMVTCLALTSSSACDASADAYFSCTSAIDVTCDAAGKPHFPGCGDEYLIAVGCAVTENPNPAIEQPCDANCDNVVAAACEYNGTKSECYTNCMWLGATGTGCSDEWATYLDCANAVTMECLLGFAVAPGCGTEFAAYSSCIDAAGN